VHIKVSEVMEWDCQCIRRRLIIICTKYFVIVNYGAATGFRGRDQAPLGETGKRGERFCVRLPQSRVQIRALWITVKSSARSGPLQSGKLLSTTLVFHTDDHHRIFFINRIHSLIYTRCPREIIDKLEILFIASIK